MLLETNGIKNLADNARSIHTDKECTDTFIVEIKKAYSKRKASMTITTAFLYCCGYQHLLEESSPWSVKMDSSMLVLLHSLLESRTDRERRNPRVKR